MRRGTERDLLVDVTPYEPTEAGHQQQQYCDSRPAEPLVGAIPPFAFTARLTGILGKAHPAVFIADCGGVMRREVTSDPFFLVEAHNPGILAHHAAVKYPSRKDVEVLLFEGYQVTVADLSDPGNGVQGNPAKLPLLPQCVTEIPHTNHPSADNMPTFHHKTGVFPGQKLIMKPFCLLRNQHLLSYWTLPALIDPGISFNFATLG